MESYNTQNDGIQKYNVNSTLPSRATQIEKWFRLYNAKFHFITIPVGIIVAIIHLRYGVKYLGQCTIQPMINIYMIVHAAVLLLLSLLALTGVVIVRFIYPRLQNDYYKIIARRAVLVVLIFTLILFLFTLAWIIAGSVWVFGVKSDVQGSNPDATTTYCQSDLYKAAFTLIIVNYVVHGVIIVLIIVKRIHANSKQTTSPSFQTMG